MAIDNLYELSNTITAVVNRALEIVTERSGSGQRYIDHDDVAGLISEEDYRNYFDLIASELSSREEVLDLDTADYELDINCGLAWCKAYEPLPEEDIEHGYLDLRAAPSMARLAEIGEKVLQHMVLEDVLAKISPEELGITKEELDAVRSTTGYQRSPFGENDVQRLPLASKPLTDKSYEDLIILSEIQKESMKDPMNPPGVREDPVFQVCVNAFGQMDDGLLARYPDSRKAYEEIFSKPCETSAYRYGAIVSGEPALILNYEIDKASFDAHGIEDSEVYHGAVAMMTGQLNSIFEQEGACISSGRATGDKNLDEIMAIIPANADPERRAQFEKAFDKAIHEMPFTKDPAWVQTQYEAILAQVTKRLPESYIVSPSTKQFPEKAAIKACEEYGKFLGKFQKEWSQAVLTHDQAKMDRLTEVLDLTKNPERLEAIVNAGIYESDKDLSTPVRLFTTDPPDITESFTVSKGQLCDAMEKMSYEKGHNPIFFLFGISPEMAKEVKDLEVSPPQKPSLDEQMRSAQLRKEQAALERDAKNQAMDRGGE